MPRKLSRTLRLVATGALAAGALVAAPGAASAAECPVVPTSQFFAPVGDYNEYFMVPGGDFETAGVWQTSGSVRYAKSDKKVEYAGARQALELDAGASTLSPEFCVDVTRPHLRFGSFAVNGKGVLYLDAVRRDGSVRPLAAIHGKDHVNWAATTFVGLAAPVGAYLPGTTVAVRFRINTLYGKWRVDGVAVDPARRG